MLNIIVLLLFQVLFIGLLYFYKPIFYLGGALRSWRPGAAAPFAPLPPQGRACRAVPGRARARAAVCAGAGVTTGDGGCRGRRRKAESEEAVGEGVGGGICTHVSIPLSSRGICSRLLWQWVI